MVMRESGLTVSVNSVVIYVWKEDYSRTKIECKILYGVC